MLFTSAICPTACNAAIGIAVRGHRSGLIKNIRNSGVFWECRRGAHEVSILVEDNVFEIDFRYALERVVPLGRREGRDKAVPVFGQIKATASNTKRIPLHAPYIIFLLF